jgi:hypothetical protein
MGCRKQYRQALKKLGHTHKQAGDALGVTECTSRRHASGATAISNLVANEVRALLARTPRRVVVVIAMVVIAFVVAGSSGRNRKWQQLQWDAWSHGNSNVCSRRVASVICVPDAILM